jgi:hypothetical protein
VGILLRHGKFKFLDMGDLSWNYEKSLVCPENLIGTVDVFKTTHHGLDPLELTAVCLGVSAARGRLDHWAVHRRSARRFRHAAEVTRLAGYLSRASPAADADGSEYGRENDRQLRAKGGVQREFV